MEHFRRIASVITIVLILDTYVRGQQVLTKTARVSQKFLKGSSLLAEHSVYLLDYYVLTDCKRGFESRRV